MSVKMLDYVCCICESSDCRVINTHKHCWFLCLDCFNIRRVRKDKYPLQHFAPYLHAHFPDFLRKIPKIRAIENMFDHLSEKPQHASFYEYYIDRFLKEPFSIDNTKYATEYKDFLTILKDNNINFMGDNFLDLCGEPGYLAYHVQKKLSF